MLRAVLIAILMASALTGQFLSSNARRIMNVPVCSASATPSTNNTFVYDGTCWNVGAAGSGTFDESSLSTLVNNQTLWDSSQATRDLTAGLSGATDPIIRFANDSIDLRASAVLKSGTALITGIGLQNNAGSDVGGLYTKFRCQNGTGTTCTLTDLGSGIGGLAVNVDTTSFLTLTGAQSFQNKTSDGQLLFTAIAAPSTPGAGLGTLYWDSTSKNIAGKDDAGVVKHGVQDASCTNQVVTAINAAGASTCTTLSTAYLPAAVKANGFGASFDGGGSAIATNATAYMTISTACTIAASNILVDTGTLTFKVWRAATGTAIPTSGGSINTSGIAISTGTALRTTTTSDYTDTTLDANDILAISITAISGATKANIFVECNQ